MKLRKIWDFIWNNNSLASWLVTLVLAMLIVKFIFFPLAGLIFSTQFPLVAVVSSSMEHNGASFDEWWEANKGWYEEREITEEEFREYTFKNGFNKGDVMVVFGTPFEKLKKGEVIIFQGGIDTPIIHRVTFFNGTKAQTKGDNNSRSDPTHGEENITEERYFGRAVLRIPYAGWLKIIMVEAFNSFKRGF